MWLRLTSEKSGELVLVNMEQAQSVGEDARGEERTWISFAGSALPVTESAEEIAAMLGVEE